MERPLIDLSSADATAALGASAGVTLGYALTAAPTERPVALVTGVLAVALLAGATALSLSIVLGTVTDHE